MLYLNFVFLIAVHTQDDTDGETTTPEDTWYFNNGTRIVGGSVAAVGQFPYQVMLLRSN
jgi:hypothetical protein